MKQKTALIVIFTLLFLIIFNTNPNATVTVNASSSRLKLINSDIEDGDENVSAYTTFTLTFNKNIKLSSGNIELFNLDSSRRENIKTDINGHRLKIRPTNRMKSSSDYWLVLEKGSVVDMSGNSIDEISYYFVVQGGSEDSEYNSDSEGKTYGIRFGETEGQLSGYMDSLSGKKTNWSKAIPLNREIIKNYNLNKETVTYRNAFLRDFEESFKKAYKEAFRDENFKDNLATKEDGSAHGRTIGMLEGENQGKLDYINGKNNNWKSSIPSDITIIQKYNLRRDYFEYRESFLVGYKDGFRESYNFDFRDQNLEVAEGSLNVSYISMHGGEVNSYDGAVKLKIEPGSFYEETGISIEKTALYDSFFSSDITPATDSYNIRIQNLLNSVNLKKPITIEFEYYGPKEGAIHELKNGRRSYLYSRIEDNKIYTDIYTNRYSGGTYAVLINEKYEAVDDISGHWAVQPIETFLRRNYINGYSDKTFRPDQSITRAEFVKILDNVHNWDRYPFYICESKGFKDSPVFGSFANSISKAVSLGYVKGYNDNTFRPHIPINYQEIEWLMQRVAGRYNFKWDIVAEKILKDYYVYSKSYNSKQNYITRAEVVYMLYLLEEGLI